jgi:hypothetical protein
MGWTNPTTRIAIILLIAAGVLESAICVAAHSLGRRRGEAALAQVKSQAEEVQSDAAQRLAAADDEKADLGKRLALAKAKSDEQAKKLVATEKEIARLQGDLDTAKKQIADLTQNQKYADARIQRAEEAAAEAREAERKARLVADSVKRDTAATVAKVKAAEVDVVRAAVKKRGNKNGKNNNNNVAAAKRRGPVASLPRTTPSFSELDKHHDGRLTLDEYKAGYPDVPNVEEEFKALDTNGDGYLSIDEYKAGHPDPPVVRTPRAKKN